MQKKFLSNLFLIVLLNLLVKPFYLLGIDAEVQNRVGAEVYGNYFALLNFSFLLNIILDFGISNYSSRNIAQHPKLIQTYFGKLLGIRLVLFLFYIFFTIVGGLSIGYDSNELFILGILVLNQFFVATIQYTRSNFGGLHLFKTEAFISILDKGLLIILCSFLLWSPFVEADFKIKWFIYAQSFAYFLTAILSILMLKYKIKKISIRVKKLFSLALLKQSFPYALLILLMMFYNRIDSVMLERMLMDGDKQAGIYAQGFRYFDAVNMFALLFASLLLPIFAKMIKFKNSIVPVLELGVKLLLPVSLIIGITAYYYQFTLIDLRYSENSIEASTSFGFLILAFIPVSITYIFGTLLTANGSLKQLNFMALGGLILNVSLNLLLIPLFKSEGAALATLATQIVTAGVQVVLVMKIFNLKIHWNLLLKLLTLIVVIVAINQFSMQQQLFMISKIVSLVLVIISCTIVAFSLGVIPLKSALNILKSTS